MNVGVGGTFEGHHGPNRDRGDAPSYAGRATRSVSLRRICCDSGVALLWAGHYSAVHRVGDRILRKVVHSAEISERGIGGAGRG